MFHSLVIRLFIVWIIILKVSLNISPLLCALLQPQLPDYNIISNKLDKKLNSKSFTRGHSYNIYIFLASIILSIKIPTSAFVKCHEITQEHGMCAFIVVLPAPLFPHLPTCVLSSTSSTSIYVPFPPL